MSSIEIVKINRLLRKLNKLKKNLKKVDLSQLPQDGCLDYLNDSLDLLSDDCDSICLGLHQKPNNLKNHLIMYQQSCQNAKYLFPYYYFNYQYEPKTPNLKCYLCDLDFQGPEQKRDYQSHINDFHNNYLKFI